MGTSHRPVVELHVPAVYFHAYLYREWYVNVKDQVIYRLYITHILNVIDVLPLYCRETSVQCKTLPYILFQLCLHLPRQ